MSDKFATKAQLEELAAYMAGKINVPVVGVGGGFAPIGTIIPYMGTTAPQDYLACDGSNHNIADYTQLAEFIEAQFGSVNYFGGNGTTTFAVPDLRGEFLRGTGTNSHTGQGSGANVGVHQDATEHIDIHSISDGDLEVYTSSSSELDAKTKADSTLNASGTGNYKRAVDGSIKSTGGDYTNYTSRPTNTSILWCIKAVAAGEVYSETERVVGTWIDGKPIYQKTWTGLNVDMAYNQWTSIVAAPEGANLIIKNILLGKDSSNNPVDISSSGYELFIEGGYIKGEWNQNVNRRNIIAITVQYTKTTD